MYVNCVCMHVYVPAQVTTNPVQHLFFLVLPSVVSAGLVFGLLFVETSMRFPTLVWYIHTYIYYVA